MFPKPTPRPTFGDLVRVKIKLVVLGQRMIIDVHLGPQMGKKGLDSRLVVTLDQHRVADHPMWTGTPQTNAAGDNGTGARSMVVEEPVQFVKPDSASLPITSVTT